MLKKSKFLLVASLMTGAATTALLAKHSSEINVARVLAGAHVDVLAINANPFTGTVDLEGVSGAFGTGRVQIGRVRLHKDPLSLIGSAHAAGGDEATFEDVSAEIGPYTIDIPEIVVTGSDLSESAIGTLFDPKSAGSMAERVAKFNAASAVSEEITVTVEFGDSSSETTYSNFKATNISAGKIASATIESTESSSDTKDKQTITTTVGQMTATNVNMPGLLRVMMETAKGDEAPVALIDSVVDRDFEVDIEDDKGAGAFYKIGSLTETGIKGRPLKAPLADLMKALKETKPDQKMTPEQERKLLPAFADIFQAFEASAEAKDITFGQLEDKAGFKGSLSRFAVSDFGKGGVGNIAYEGLNIDSKDGNFKLASAGIKGLMIGPFLGALGEAAKTDYKDFNPRAALPALSQISINGLALDVATDKKDGNSPDGSRIKLALGKFEVNLADYITGIPGSANTSIEHLAFDLPKTGEDPSLKQLQAAGIDKIDASAKLDLAYAAADQAIKLKELSLGSTGLAKLTANGTIGNVSKDVFSTDSNVAIAAALGAVVKSLDIKLENSGAVDKFITVQAKAENKSPDDYKKELIGIAAVGIPGALGGDGPAGKTIANAVAKFLADPKNLHITATSKDGLGASDMGLISTPADLLKKIDVTAGANE